VFCGGWRMESKTQNYNPNPKNFVHENFFMPILHFQRRRKNLLNLQRMGPPQFKERVPHTHFLEIEDREKKV